MKPDSVTQITCYPKRICSGIEQDIGGLGDNCMGSIIADMMREHGYDIYFYTKLRNFEKLVHNIKRQNGIFLESDYFIYSYTDPKYSIPLSELRMTNFIDAFFKFNGLSIRFDGRGADVIFIPLLENRYKVVLNTRCSNFSEKRLWPFFSDLKLLLKKEKISFIDLDDTIQLSYNDQLSSFYILNLVRNSDLYIGLDSGMSHYVAKMVNLAYIIQSGHSFFENWCKYSRYEYIALDVPCRPCWVNEENLADCTIQDKCMQDIYPEIVFENIRQLL